MKKVLLVIVALLFTAALIAAIYPRKKVVQSIESKNLEAAWDNFNAVGLEVEESLINSKAYDLDDYHRMAAYDLMRMLISSQLDGEISEGWGDYPHFRAMLDPGLRFGIDNPDTYYRSANISNPEGQSVYRVWGNRGTTADFLFEMLDATRVDGAFSVLDDQDMHFDKNGNFELYLSKDPMEGNWMYLPEDPMIVSFIARNTFADWEKEEAGVLNIERIGMRGTPSRSRTEGELAEQLDRVSNIMRSHGIFWPEFSKKLMFLPKNTMIKFRPTGEIGILTQYNSLGQFHVEEDEALIITLPEINADYCGFHIANFWGSSPDWVNRFSSLSWGRDGAAQAFKDNSGSYTVILSSRDPGIQNWVDTCEMTRGVLVMRVQSAAQDGVEDIKPKIKKVKFRDIDSHIPPEMPRVSLEERSEHLSRRQLHVNKRYEIW